MTNLLILEVCGDSDRNLQTWYDKCMKSVPFGLVDLNYEQKPPCHLMQIKKQAIEDDSVQIFKHLIIDSF